MVDCVDFRKVVFDGGGKGGLFYVCVGLSISVAISFILSLEQMR